MAGIELGDQTVREKIDCDYNRKPSVMEKIQGIIGWYFYEELILMGFLLDFFPVVKGLHGRGLIKTILISFIKRALYKNRVKHLDFKAKTYGIFLY